MDARSADDAAPVVAAGGDVAASWLVSPREMFEIAGSGRLELVSEFEVAHEASFAADGSGADLFLYVTTGRGCLTLAGEEREIGAGDLVHIPPRTPGALRPLQPDAPLHCFRFTTGPAPPPGGERSPSGEQ